MTFQHLKLSGAAALLALFAAGCQPDAKPADTAEVAAPAVEAPGGVPGATGLAAFRTGQFADLDLDQDLTIPASPFVDLAGNPHSFAEYKGKVVVYNVWAEWCAPCVEEMPTLAGLQKAFAGKDVVVIPVTYGVGAGVTRESSAARLEELVGKDLPFFFDGELNVNSDAKTGALPSTIIYDKAGKEQARLMFPAKWDAPDAIALVQAVLDGAS